MSTALNLPDVLTVDAFLAWDTPMGPLWQLVDGTPQATAPASPTHAAIQAEVTGLIRNQLTAQGSTRFVVTAPVSFRGCSLI